MAEHGDAKLTDLLHTLARLPLGAVREHLRSMQGGLRGACGTPATARRRSQIDGVVTISHFSTRRSHRDQATLPEESQG